MSHRTYSKRPAADAKSLLPEDNWVWSPQGAVDMHMPERWGYVQFSSLPPGRAPEPLKDVSNERVKWALRRLYYYRQVRFRARTGAFATRLEVNTSDVRVEVKALPA